MRQLVKHCKALVVLVVRCLADLSGPSTWSGQMGEMGQTDEAEGTRSGKVFASVAVERLLRVATAIIALDGPRGYDMATQDLALVLQTVTQIVIPVSAVSAKGSAGAGGAGGAGDIELVTEQVFAGVAELIRAALKHRLSAAHSCIQMILEVRANTWLLSTEATCLGRRPCAPGALWAPCVACMACGAPG